MGAVVETIFLLALLSQVAPFVSGRPVSMADEEMAQWYTSTASTGLGHTHHPSHEIQTINDLQRDFFLESSLCVGAKMLLTDNLFDPIPSRPFLSRKEADLLPSLKNSNLEELMQLLNVEPNTPMATMLETTVFLCENPALPGEERACPTSWESMAEFVESSIGKNVEMLSTSGAPAEAPEVKSPVAVLDFKKRSLEEGRQITVCHNVMFPTQVYYCHLVTGTIVIEATLAPEVGELIHAIGICHLDTSKWLSRHPAFKALGIPKGHGACHWTVENDVIWVPAKSSREHLESKWE